MIAIDRTDLPVTIEGDGVQLRMAEVGELTVSWITLAADVDLGPALVGLPDDRCPCPHWGYLLSGRLLMRTPDGDREYRAGQAFYWAPGHAPRALEDSEYVDFSPTADFAKVIAHIQGGGR